MSTKNLSRTVIEGGRAAWNRWERRHSNVVQRRAVRHASSAELASSEHGHVLYPVRKVVYKGFADKLRPATRWLEAQIGRPWSKVRAELMQRFDTRTTAGRHIVFDHLLPAVEDSSRGGLPRASFVVDRHGILREPPPLRARRTQYVIHGPPPAEAVEWLETRRVGDRDGTLYWFLLTRSGAYRQANALSPDEVERFCALPPHFRAQIDALARGH